MSSEHSTDVFVFVGVRGAAKESDHRFLAGAVARVAGVDPGAVRIEQRCERCRGPHGRPVVVHPTGLANGPLHVSLSRAGNAVAVAVTLGGPVGIDIEEIAAASRATFADVAFNGAELAELSGLDPAELAWTRAAMWTGKEAVLKAWGVGLRVDPRELTVSVPARDHSVPVVLEAWRGAAFDLGSMRLAHFEPGAGLVGTVALLGPRHPRVRLMGPAGQDRAPVTGSGRSQDR